jgi:hypothetical protein
MLLGNITQIAQNCIRYSAYNGTTERSMLGTNTSNHLLRFSYLSKQSAIPNGYTIGSAWFPAITGGGMSMILNGSSSVGIYPANIALTGSGDITTNTILGLGNIICNLTGSCTLSITSTLITQLGMVCSMTGQGDVTANINAFGNMVAQLLGSGGLSGLPAGIADMSVDIIVTGTGLNSANVGKYVWDAIAVEHDNTGTLGKLLNDVGAGANPWIAEIPGDATGTQAGNVLSEIQKKANMIPGLY